MESDALQTVENTVENQNVRIKLLEAVLLSDAGPREIAEIARELGMEALGLVELINDPSFMAEVRKVTFARASLALHSRGINELISMAQRGRDHDRLTAWRTIATMTGDLMNKHERRVRVTFEDLRSRPGGTLEGLFDIRSDVIEVEIEDDQSLG